MISSPTLSLLAPAPANTTPPFDLSSVFSTNTAQPDGQGWDFGSFWDDLTANDLAANSQPAIEKDPTTPGNQTKDATGSTQVAISALCDDAQTAVACLKPINSSTTKQNTPKDSDDSLDATESDQNNQSSKKETSTTNLSQQFFVPVFMIPPAASLQTPAHVRNSKTDQGPQLTGPSASNLAPQTPKATAVLDSMPPSSAVRTAPKPLPADASTAERDILSFRLQSKFTAPVNVANIRPPATSSFKFTAATSPSINAAPVADLSKSPAPKQVPSPIKLAMTPAYNLVTLPPKAPAETKQLSSVDADDPIVAGQVLTSPKQPQAAPAEADPSAEQEVATDVDAGSAPQAPDSLSSRKKPDTPSANDDAVQDSAVKPQASKDVRPVQHVHNDSSADTSDDQQSSRKSPLPQAALAFPNHEVHIGTASPSLENKSAENHTTGASFASDLPIDRQDKKSVQPVKEMNVQLEGQRGEKVNVKFSDQDGRIQVIVRSSDQLTASTLRQDLSSLTSSLDHTGWKMTDLVTNTSTSNSQLPGASQSSSGSDNSNSNNGDRSQTGFQQRQGEGKRQSAADLWDEKLMQS